jgi:hypothetical protein
MGLKITGTTTLSTGFAFADAYVNIASMRYNKSKEKLNVVTNVFKSKADRLAGKSPIVGQRGFFAYDCTSSDLESSYLYVFAYNKLKLSAYTDSVDEQP